MRQQRSRSVELQLETNSLVNRKKSFQQIIAQNHIGTLDTEIGLPVQVLVHCLLVFDFTITLILFCFPFARCLLLNMGFSDAHRAAGHGCFSQFASPQVLLSLASLHYRPGLRHNLKRYTLL